jgi:ATP-dependent DNA helicase RecQ
VREAVDHLRSQPLVLEPKKMAPDADGRMRKIPSDVTVEEGRALARLGDGGWDPVVQAALRGEGVPDALVDAARRLVHAWKPPVGYVAAVPSARHPGLVDDVARRLADALGLPFVALLARSGERPPQREMSNAAQQAANVRGAFRIVADPPGEPCLLVDDVRLSGWTLAMVGGQLRRRGSGPVFPLALATAF